MPGVKYTVDVEVNGGQKVESTNRSFEKTGQNVQKINQRLKSMQQELYAMAEGGDKSSKAFLDMAKNAGNLKNAMGDTRAIVNYFADGERAVNGMNNAISATTSVVQGLYGTYSLLGGEANDKLLKNMVALESMNARLSNAYNLLKPDGKAMLYMNEMAKKGNIFAGAMSKAGGFVFKMIPAFKALSIASFVGEVTGVNDKLKEWITNTETFKGILSTVGVNLPDVNAIQQSGNLGKGQSTDILRKISSGVSPDVAIRNLSGGAQEEFKKSYPELFSDEVRKNIQDKESIEKRLLDSKRQLELAKQQGKNILSWKNTVESYEKALDKNTKEAKWQAKASSYIVGSNPSGKSNQSKSSKGLKTTKNNGERLASAAPQTFNIYISKLNEMNGTIVGGQDDLDKFAKNMAEVLRQMLVTTAASQAVS